MPYEITATRKRPQGFEELAGQEFVSATLVASLQSGRIAHAYLFSGPRGCGKTSTARILAKALNCEEGPTAKPCGVCSSCRSIAAGSSLDVIEIDGASNTSVDNVRQIKDEVLFPPNSGRYKVYIIDEVHMLSMSAFNALLKTIEEPPPYVVFIFATTELHKVPATIKSRCQQFAFRLIPIEQVKKLLISVAAELGVEAEDEALLWIAKESGGSLRDAYTLFDQVVAFSDGRMTSAKIRDKLGLVGLDAMNGLFEALVCTPSSGTGTDEAGRSGAAGDAGRGLEALDAILERGVSPEQLVLDAVEYCRALLLLKNGIDRESLLGAAKTAYSARVLDALGSEQIERALGELLELHRSIRFTVDPRFELELAAARLARLPGWVSTTELAKTVMSLKKRLAGGLPAIQAGAPEQRPAQVNGATGEAAGPSVRSGAGGSSAQRPGGDEVEKKKPEFSAGLKSALTSLAATVAPPGAVTSSREEVDDDDLWETDPAPPPPIVKAAAPGPAAVLPAGPASPEVEDEGEGEESFDPPGAPAKAEGDGDTAALKRAVLDSIGRASPLLRTGLAASLPWLVEPGRVVIPFRNGMEESVVKGEMAALAQAVAKAAGRALRVELKVAQAERGASGAPGEAEAENAADIVAHVFRGQKIAGKTTGGNDGL
jgi:DNA polymerase-3 subunit gamma/tau